MKAARMNEVQEEIAEECDALKWMLIEKNKAYGNSALEPVRIFSKAPTIEQLLVRIDDKLSRLARGHAVGEDVELDLMGYLVLLRVARKMEAAACPGSSTPKPSKPSSASQASKSPQSGKR